MSGYDYDISILGSPSHAPWLVLDSASALALFFAMDTDKYSVELYCILYNYNSVLLVVYLAATSCVFSCSFPLWPPPPPIVCYAIP